MHPSHEDSTDANFVTQFEFSPCPSSPGMVMAPNGTVTFGKWDKVFEAKVTDALGRAGGTRTQLVPQATL